MGEEPTELANTHSQFIKMAITFPAKVFWKNYQSKIVPMFSVKA